MSVVTVNALADACVEAAELAPRPPRALSAAEGVGEEDAPGPTLEQLRSLREDVAARCDFL